MRRFGFIGFLVLALLVGAVGVVAYNAGISTGAAEAALAEGATVVYQPSGGSPFGIIFGIFILLLVFGFIAKIFFRPAMPYGPGDPGGWGGRHWAGRKDWDHENVPEPFRPMLEKWHRETHGDHQSGASGPQAAPPPGRTTTTAGSAGVGQPPSWPPAAPRR